MSFLPPPTLLTPSPTSTSTSFFSPSSSSSTLNLTQTLYQMVEIHASCIKQDGTLATFLPPLDRAKMVRWWEERMEEVRRGERVVVVQFVDGVGDDDQGGGSGRGRGREGDVGDGDGDRGNNEVRGDRDGRKVENPIESRNEIDRVKKTDGQEEDHQAKTKMNHGGDAGSYLLSSSSSNITNTNTTTIISSNNNKSPPPPSPHPPTTRVVAGLVTLSTPSGAETGCHRAWVEKLLVSPSFRRRGIARRLLEFVETVALGRGRTMLLLDTDVKSSAAEVYERLGWVRIGVVEGYGFSPIYWEGGDEVNNDNVGGEDGENGENGEGEGEREKGHIEGNGKEKSSSKGRRKRKLVDEVFFYKDLSRSKPVLEED